MNNLHLDTENQKKYLVLKIDVDTHRGTREGVPNLIQLFQELNVKATFLFSMGPDHTGWAIKRVFRKGFLSKVSRTSVLEHYGLKTLLYGTLLPAPDITNSKESRKILKQCQNLDFEVGIHCWDHVYWQDNVMTKNADWTKSQFQPAIQRFREIFNEIPKVHGSAGWQMNIHALRLIQQLGFDYSSDCRGNTPFYPVYHGEISHCPQLPTTLPTLDELIGLNNITTNNVAEYLLNLTSKNPQDHVFTLHAELEGMKLIPVLKQLITGWIHQNYDIVTLNQYYNILDKNKIPYHNIQFDGEIEGRSGVLTIQGDRFLK